MSNRYVLLDETQSCLWRSPNEIPEVEIKFASVIEDHATLENAMQAAKRLLAKVNAGATFADVRPIEECAKCSSDFETHHAHHALVISEESGDEENPQIEQVWYVARFCPDCDKALEGGL